MVSFGKPNEGKKPVEIIAVFVQAAADTGYALTICDRATKRGATVLLIVVLVRSLYEYLLDIPLGSVELYFVPYLLQPMPRSPWALFDAHRQLASHYSSIFRNRSVAEAWFFCAQWDAVTPYFLRRLSRTTQIFLADHYCMPEVREKRWPLRLFVKWLFLRLATGVSFDFCKEKLETGSEVVWRTTFDPSMCRTKRVEITPRWSCIPLPVTVALPTVILMDSNEDVSPVITEYRSIVSAVLANLSSRKINVLLKVHPRVGCSAFLKAYNLPALPAGCPLELFDIGGIRAVIGVSSLGLAAIAKLGYPAVSLLYLIDFRDEDSRTFWREWLDRHSDGKVQYPQSIPEVVEIIDKSSEIKQSSIGPKAG